MTLLLATLLLATLLLIAACHLSRQLAQQHREIMQLIDALAEMIGEAIDQNERN